MHRDIKPENIVFRSNSDSTDIVLVDFGFAELIKNPKMIFNRCGTPGYVAPEVLEYRTGRPFYNERCDIFSVGVVFYVLLVFI